MGQTNLLFPNLGLDERVLDQVRKLGFTRPTQVQEKVIPLVLGKKNLLVEAPTGTGKTAAYGLPLLSRIDFMKKTTHVVVLIPSRELAIQVAEALRTYCDHPAYRVGLVYGGQTVAEAEQVVRQTPHILVAVPGMLRNVMGHSQYDYLWRNVRYLIVDEGDKLLESGFQSDFDEIRKRIRGTAQVCFFSATISPDAEKMIRERVENIEVVRIRPQAVLRNIAFLQVDATGKREQMLIHLLKGKDISQALIFSGRRQDIFSVTNLLRNNGLRAEAYHGALTQEERANILERFREGHFNYLVASDLAARGLDIEDLPAVINLNITKEYDFYLHRVGRTGRAGKKGAVYNLISSGAEAAYLANHHKLMGIPVKTIQVEAGAIAPVAADRRWTKVALTRGAKDKLRKGDVVGFLVNQAELSSDDIGTITVLENYTVVDLPLEGYESLIYREDLKIKNLSVKIRKYSVEEQENKAAAVKKLVRKRNIK